MMMDQLGQYGTKITLVHYVFQIPERIACMPSMREFHQTDYHPSYQRTNDPRAVTCPGCKRTDVYQQAIQQTRIMAQER